MIDNLWCVYDLNNFVFIIVINKFTGQFYSLYRN